MILILTIEIAQTVFSGYALWYSWQRWKLAEHRRVVYQAQKKNGVRGFANRLRSSREWDRLHLQLNMFAFSLAFLSWRLTSLHRPVPVIASLVFHYPFIYGSIWAHRQTLKDIQSEGELRSMDEYEDHQAAKRIAITDSLQAGIDTANTKLDEMKAREGA